jgi:hypothetical protein
MKTFLLKSAIRICNIKNISSVFTKIFKIYILFKYDRLVLKRGVLEIICYIKRPDESINYVRYYSYNLNTVT